MATTLKDKIRDDIIAYTEAEEVESIEELTDTICDTIINYFKSTLEN